MRKIITILFTLILLASCGLNDRKNELSFIKEPNVEFDSDFNSCNLVESIKGQEVKIKEIKGNVIAKNDYRVSCSAIDTKTMGKQKVYFDFNGKMYQLIVNIIDTTPPEIIVLEKPNNVKEGEKSKPLDFITAYDPSGIASLGIEGKFDIGISGEYPLVAIATDNNGNISRKAFVYKVE